MGNKSFTPVKVLRARDVRNPVRSFQAEFGHVFYSFENDIRVWPTHTGSALDNNSRRCRCQSRVNSICLHRGVIYSALENGTFRSFEWEYDKNKSRSLHTYAMEGTRLALRAMCADNDILYLGGEEGTVRAWDPETAAPFRAFEGHRFPVTYITAHARQLFTGDSEGNVMCWDLRSARRIWERRLRPRVDSLVVSSGILFAAHSANRLSALLLDDGARAETLDLCSPSKTTCACADGVKVYVGHDSGRVDRWNTKSRKRVTLYQHSDRVQTIAMEPRYVYSATRNSIVKLRAK